MMGDLPKRKASNLFSPENWLIALAILLMMVFAAKRFAVSIPTQNLARAKKELERIYVLEHTHHINKARYGTLEEVGFVPKYPTSKIDYSVRVDSLEFLAFATEIAGADPFGDNRAGNEYIAINTAKMIFEGASSK